MPSGASQDMLIVPDLGSYSTRVTGRCVTSGFWGARLAMFTVVFKALKFMPDAGQINPFSSFKWQLYLLRYSVMASVSHEVLNLGTILRNAL